MTAALIPTPHRGQAGMSVLEVIIGCTMLAVCALAMGESMLTAMMNTTSAGEYAAAYRAAQDRLDSVLSRGKFLTATASEDARGVNIGAFGVVEGQTFEVYVPNQRTGEYDPATGQGIRLQGVSPTGAAVPAGEIVIINRESATRNDFGRDLNNDGMADGVMFTQFPIDLNMSGSFESTSIQGSARMLPVGAIVRWVSARGREERVELWTVIHF